MMSVFRRCTAAASFVLLAFAAVTTHSVAALAAPIPPAVSAKFGKGAADLEKLWANDRARLPVIVEFSLPQHSGNAGLDSAAAQDSARITAVHAAQDAILGSLFGGNDGVAAATADVTRSLTRMDFSPMFATSATAADLEKLAADARVIRIHQDGTSVPQLIQSVPLIGMPGAYATGATGNGWVVAVIDTGVRRSHEFLAGKVVSAACYSRNDPSQNILPTCPGGVTTSTAINAADDCDTPSLPQCGHGTHIAGVVAGFNTNLQGGGAEPPNGVARHVGILSINVHSYKDNQLVAFESSQIQGLERVYALRNNFQIAAVALALANPEASGTDCTGDPRQSIIDQLRAANIATVVAAGNDGSNTGVSAPACIPAAIAVAASTKQDQRASFSNWSAGVDLVAPGAAILSSRADAASTTLYAQLDGTSVAAAHVAGAFAALRSGRPQATVDQIEAALKSTGLTITSAGISKPRIRVDQAATELGTQGGPPNDNFVDRITIAGPGTVTGSNVLATSEPGEPAGFNSVWWSFTPTVSGPFTVQTVGSSFDTVLTVYNGTVLGGFTEQESNDDIDRPAGDIRSRVTFPATAGTSYAIAVTSRVSGGTGAVSLRLITARPVNDNIANATTINGLGTVVGTNLNATAEFSEPSSAGRSSVWWRYTPTASGPIILDTQLSDFNTVLSVYGGPSFLNLLVTNDNANSATRRSKVILNGVAGTTYNIAVTGETASMQGIVRLRLSSGAPGSLATIVAAVAPSARSAVAGAQVTAFGTIINAGPGMALGCYVAKPASSSNVTFSYRTITNGQFGDLNTPVDIPANGRQDFFLTISATLPGSIPQNLEYMVLVFNCLNAQQPAATIRGVNDFALRLTDIVFFADVIAAAATTTGDGILNIPIGGTGFASVAAQNLGEPADGSSQPLQARLSTSPIVGTGSALPVNMVICRTNPGTGACITAPIGTTVDFNLATNEVATFAAFLTSDGTAIPFDPANKRLFVHFFQYNGVVGSTSVAVRTTAADVTAAR